MELAEAYYRQGLQRAEERGMRPRQAGCHLDLGTLYRRRDAPRDGDDLLNQSHGETHMRPTCDYVDFVVALV